MCALCVLDFKARESVSVPAQVESDLVEGSGGDENTAEEVREGGEPRTSCDDGEDDEGEGGVCGVTSVLNLTHHRVSPHSLFLSFLYPLSLLPTLFPHLS